MDPEVKTIFCVISNIYARTFFFVTVLINYSAYTSTLLTQNMLYRVDCLLVTARDGFNCTWYVKDVEIS